MIQRALPYLASLKARINTHSIKFKVSVLYTVVLGMILLMFSAVLYVGLSYYLYQRIDEGLKVEARETLETLNAYLEAAGDKPGALEFAVGKTFFYNFNNYPVSIFNMGRVKRLDMRWQERADAMGLNDNYMAFTFPGTRVMFKSLNFPSKMQPAFTGLYNIAAKRKHTSFYNLHFKNDVLRIIAVPYAGLNGQVGMLQIGASQRQIEQLLRGLVQAIVLGIPLVLILTSFVGLLFVKRILDPIEDIARTASQITYKDLAARVKNVHPDEEIKYLVASFNDMIGRLERSFQHINEFSSQVAHELKTPLAIIRGESELALGQDRMLEDYKATIRINLEEANRMRKTIEDLLLLARLDYQPDVFRSQSFDATEFFQEIYEQAKILAADKGLEVEAELPQGPVPLKGDKLHLRRMFFNIIDNALKFTVPPGTIKIKVMPRRKVLLVLISDTGVGIPEEDLSKVFEKFYHVDRTGRNEGGCTGLGLSIVQSISKIHKGTVHVTSKLGEGTTFHIMLPLPAPSKD